MVLEKLKGKEKEKDNISQNEAARAAAAVLIQRVWRGKHNKVKDQYLTADWRWNDAAKGAKLAVDRDAAAEGKNDPLVRWRRAVHFVIGMRDKNLMLRSEGVDKDVDVKQLETQHWLEMIDGKHRYGSNLKWYHKRWQEDDTVENFFHWLDEGGGKGLSLDECPRDTLEKERIIYLSAEQRINYLVTINDEGKLLWAKNDQPVDTTAGHWKDGGNGQGVVPQSFPTNPKPSESKRTSRPVPFGRSPSAAGSSSSAQQENAAMHYAGDSPGKHRWTRYLRRHFTPRGLMERLLRKTVQKNTWMYVSDNHFNIFVGIKETGAFQHSSLVGGGVVTSAGLITVKHGVIHTLSPLSGHYRTSIDHFHKFLDVLEERGVDMRKIQISKAEAALWGIEHLNKAKKAQGKAVSSAKKKIADVPKEVKQKIAGNEKDGPNPDKPQESKGTPQQG